MSKTIDEKVVEMRFDNKNFEQNVKTTMTTLDKFKEKLNLTGAAKGLENIENQASKLKFNGLTDGIEAVRVKFSALEVFAITALTNIANSAVNAGKRIASALTIDPIKTGFNEYEQKMDAVRVIMASAGEAEGKTLDEVTAKIQELNKYADDTIYSFSDMTTNIGKFTNAGVKLDDAVLAIKGISNEAARSGANAQEASRAMYNFAQALSMGYVQLIDWKSIENANMATVEFKNTLLETAIATGKVTKTANGMYKTGKDTYNLQQMFKDGLKDQWLTSDILIDTLKKYADESTEFGQKMYDAAKQVTTVSKLWDTLKEAAQSGWGQTWELIVGNLDEARVVLTNVSNVVSDIINQSSEARNNILKEWRELGGRNDLIDAFKNLYDSISSLLKPIKEAFREIFPKVTGKDLANITKRFKEFTSSLIINKETSENLKNTFKGLFSILKTGINIVKNIVSTIIKVLSNFRGLGSFILSITGAIGKILFDISEFISKSNVLNNVLTAISDSLSNIINGIKTFATETLKINKIADVFTWLYGIISKVASAIGTAISNIISSGKGKAGIDIINGGIFGALLLGLNSLVKKIKSFIGDFDGSIGSIKDLLSGVKDILKSYQKEIDSKTLMNIAKAIGILAVSLFVLASIDAEALGRALGGMAGLITELMIALLAFNKIASSDKLKGGTLKSSAAILSISTAILIVSGALKILATMNWDEIKNALKAMGGALAELLIALTVLRFAKGSLKSATSMLILANAMIPIAVALKILATMSWDEIKNALKAMGGALAELTAVLILLRFAKGSLKNATSMLILTNAMLVLSGALKILATMSWDEIKNALKAMGGALVELTASLILLRFAKGSLKNSVSMLIMVNSMLELAAVLKILATMSWDEIKNSLKAMGGALAELTAALILLRFAKGSLKSAAAILIIANSMVILAGVLKLLGTMSVGDIAKSLITIALALGIFGGAAALLAPLVPTMLALSGAIALFGVSLIALGAGLTLIGTGLGILTAQLVGNIDLILVSLKGLIVGFAKMIPELIRTAKDTILAFCELIIESAPTIAKTIFTVILELAKQLDEYLPVIVSTLFDFAIKVLDELAKRVPELLVGIFKVINAVFKGLREAINNLDPSILSGFIENAKSLSIIFIILAGLSKLLPSAMVGVLGFGALVVELGAIMAALGKLSQIPGLNEAIGNGGNLLENIGTGIGKFVGGVIGGIGSGITSNLPEIAKNLTKFMENLEPFIERSKSINSDVLDGMTNLFEGLLNLSKANLINGLSNLLNLGSKTPLEDFGKKLGSLGNGLSDFINSLKGIDESSVNKIKPACEAIKILAEANNSIPNQGGWLSKIIGDNDFKTWGSQLGDLGEGLYSLVSSLKGFNEDDVVTIRYVCESIKMLAEVNDLIPDQGGILSKILGENTLDIFGNQLPALGDGLNQFVEKLGNFGQDNVETVRAACDALYDISNLANSIENNGGLKLSIFGNSDLTKFAEQVPRLGEGVNGFVNALPNFNESKLEIVQAACDALYAIANLGYIDLGSLSSNLSNFGTNLIVFGASIDTFLLDISEIGLETISQSIQKVQELINMAKTISEINIDSLSSFSESLIAVAKTGVKGFCESFSGFEPLNKTKQSIKIMLEAVLKEAYDHKDKFEKVFKSLMEYSIKSVDSQREPMVNTFKNICQEIIDYINSREKDTVDAFNNICNKIIESINNLKPDMVNTGSNFVDGFAEGIRNNSYKAINEATNMAREALRATKAALDSHSPSKETEKIGGFFGEGFINGIKNSFKRVYDIAFDSGELAKNGLKDAISRMNSIINEEMNIQPVITPILDLSNIKNNSSMLDSILKNDQISRNLNAINNINLANQNGKNNDIISAINKLSDSLNSYNGNVINIYPQQLDRDSLNQIVNEVNRDFGRIYR